MVLWIGQHLATDFIQKLFGVPSITQINTELVCVLYIENYTYYYNIVLVAHTACSG